MTADLTCKYNSAFGLCGKPAEGYVPLEDVALYNCWELERRKVKSDPELAEPHSAVVHMCGAHVRNVNYVVENVKKNMHEFMREFEASRKKDNPLELSPETLESVSKLKKFPLELKEPLR